MATMAAKIKKNNLSIAKKNRFTLFSVRQGRIDYVFLSLLLLILTVGMISLFSASFANAFALYGNSYRFISRQVIYGLGGVILMLFISTINYSVYEKLVWPMYCITVVLLIAVFFFPKLSGARRWIIIGNMTFQPSEIAKFVVAVLFAHLIALNYDKMHTLRHGIIPPIALLMVLVSLIVNEPHLSATIIILSIAAIMLLVGGVKLRWFALMLIIGAIGLWLIINTDLVPYASKRINIWLDPAADPRGDGYQTLQSLYAIGSGGLMGKGIGGSEFKYGERLPELQNDYIFAIVCEELGFLGASIIVILFALLVWRGFLIATRCKDKFGSLLAVGLISQVGVQVIFNILVVTNTVPPTGVSLPFFSAGGTSLIMLLMQMGVLLSISRRSVYEVHTQGDDE